MLFRCVVDDVLRTPAWTGVFSPRLGHRVLSCSADAFRYEARRRFTAVFGGGGNGDSESECARSVPTVPNVAADLRGDALDTFSSFALCFRYL